MVISQRQSIQIVGYTPAELGSISCIAREPGGLSDTALERFASEVIQRQCEFSMTG